MSMMKRREKEMNKKEKEFGNILEEIYLPTLEINIASRTGEYANYCFKCKSWYGEEGSYHRDCPTCYGEGKNSVKQSVFIYPRKDDVVKTDLLVFLFNKIDEESFEIAKLISQISVDTIKKEITINWDLLAYTVLDINKLDKIGLVNVRVKDKIGYSQRSDISNLVSVPRGISYAFRTCINGEMPEKALKRLGLYSLFNKRSISSGCVGTSIGPTSIRKIIDLAQNHETVEKLDKLGFVNLINESYNSGSTQIIYREGNKINDIIKIPKDILSVVKNMSSKGIRAVERLASLDRDLSKDLMTQFIEKIYEKDYYSEVINILGDILCLEIPGITFNTCVNYLLETDRRQALHPSISIGIWRDYLSMSKDMFEKFDKYPKSLKLSHDLCARDYELVKDEFRDMKIAERAKKLEPLITENETYKIIFPTSSLDLIEESTALGHCVKSYAERIVSGNSDIAFLRRKDNINKPLYTIEIKNNRVVQFKGYSNSKPSGKGIEQIMDKFKNNLENVAI